MRKYTQLSLVIITVISVIVLLMYRSEYRQLKYVLDVVNFVGRKDEIALVRLENQTNFYHHSNYEFNEPLPVWQRIGNGFHAYSSFWRRPNKLVEGGEVITIVAGLKHSVVSFACESVYADSQTQKGQFRYTPVVVAPQNESIEQEFLIYKFICKIPKDAGKPWMIRFTDLNTKTAHNVAVRDLEDNKAKDLLTFTVCVDLLPKNEPHPPQDDFNLLQFFIHHHLIGIEEFLIYDFHKMSASVQRLLFLNGIRLNVFPFNFPFEMSSPEVMRTFIEMDCLLRTSNAVKYTTIVSTNDYIYTNGNIGSTPQPLLQMLKNRVFEDEMKFQLATNEICSQKNRKILSDNLIIESENQAEMPVYLYRTNAIFKRGKLDTVIGMSSNKYTRLNRELVFGNHYKTCARNKTNPKSNNLIEWRSKLSDEFRKFVDQLSVSTNSILRTIQK